MGGNNAGGLSSRQHGQRARLGTRGLNAEATGIPEGHLKGQGQGGLRIKAGGHGAGNGQKAASHSAGAIPISGSHWLTLTEDHTWTFPDVGSPCGPAVLWTRRTWIVVLSLTSGTAKEAAGPALGLAQMSVWLIDGWWAMADG